MFRILLVVCMWSFLVVNNNFAQKQAYNWYFGYYAGLSFHTNPPTVLTNGKLKTWGGCSTISDEDGKLLFYSNGLAIWNQKHELMYRSRYDDDYPVNFGHGGDISQQALIVPQPANTQLYYLFALHTDPTSNALFERTTLYYSVVDMNQNNGLGMVVNKELVLADTVMEQMAATKHFNNNDVWVVVRKLYSDKFYAYLLTGQGIQEPVISSTGFIYSTGSGYMKFSVSGNMLATVNHHKEGIGELYYFDNKTGKIKKITTLPNCYKASATEFSPDESKLYTINHTGENYIYQYNISLYDTTARIDSLIKIPVLNDSYTAAAIQLAPDGKLYLVNGNYSHMSIIHYPNKTGLSCGFEYKALYLEGKFGQFGLPNFVQSWFKPASFEYSNACKNTNTQFAIMNESNIRTAQWDFGDGNTGVGTTPNHVYKDTGNYTVRLIADFDIRIDTIFRDIEVVPAQELNIGADTVFCPGTSLLIETNDEFSTYLWQNGDTLSTINVDTPGIYHVEVTDSNNCLLQDTVYIEEVNNTLEIGNDTIICQGNKVIYDAPDWFNSYKWNTGSENKLITVSDSGSYILTATNQCGKYTDSIHLAYYEQSVINLGNDTSICNGQNLLLGTTQDYPNYLWQNNQTTRQISITPITNTTAWLQVKNQHGCTTRDSIQITVNPTPEISLGNNISICADESFSLDAGKNRQKYLWSTGASTQKITVSPSYYTANLPDSFWVSATVSNEFNCTAEDSVQITVNPLPQLQLPNDTTIELSQILYLNAGSGFLSYLWDDGTTDSTRAITTPGLYWLTVSNQHCTTTENIHVKYDETKSQVQVPNIFTPNNDTQNDNFKLINYHNVKGFDFRIYTRWGMLIYQTNDVDFKWDGKYKGKPCTPGTYYYVVRYRNTKEWQTKKGVVCIYVK